MDNLIVRAQQLAKSFCTQEFPSMLHFFNHQIEKNYDCKTKVYTAFNVCVICKNYKSIRTLKEDLYNSTKTFFVQQ